jgi:phage shock protein A
MPYLFIAGILPKGSGEENTRGPDTAESIAVHGGNILGGFVMCDVNEVEELKKRIYKTAVEYNCKEKLARDLEEKRQEYKRLLTQYEERIRIVKKHIAELDKKGMKLTAQLEKLEKESEERSTSTAGNTKCK